MAFNINNYFKNYFKKKSVFSIVTDFALIILIVLLIIPGTRTHVSSFFIKLTSLPPSTLDVDEQFTVSENTLYWQLTDLQGNKFSFQELNKKPVFLNVWATWCPPCVAELPGIEELQNEFGNEVNFIMLTNEDKSTVDAFIEKHNYHNLKIYYSPTLPSDFSTQSIPATFVLDKTGKVLVSKKGAARWNSSKMKNLLNRLIKE
ncbi:MAG: thiol-disulfide oxidoreductase [Marinilabiliales bacterium]|nr:MAG: thiol-disulfide oxidoreductase [Marinilabiliales bacterium]